MKKTRRPSAPDSLRRRRGIAHPKAKHGYAGAATGRKAPEYLTWRAMKARCLNPNDPAYPRYGGKGITICPAWHNFENFLADMGSRPAGMSLDRIDNTKGYSPKNCRWADRKTQGRNMSSNVLLTVQGVTKCLTEWAEEYKLDQGTIRWRIDKLGWPIEDAVTRPKLRNRTNRFMEK